MTIRNDPRHGLSGPHHTPAPRFPRIADMVVYYNGIHGDLYGPGGVHGDPGVVEEVPAVVHAARDPADPEGALKLYVLGPYSSRLLYDVPYGPGKPGCWGWPPVR